MPTTAQLGADPALSAANARTGARPASAPRPASTEPELPEVPPEGSPVHVRVRIERDSERPELLLWSDRLWSVRSILGYQLAEPGSAGAVAEHRWWVGAARGRASGEVLLELAQSYPSGHWRIRSVPSGVPERFRCRPIG
ncbi:hypothetical protein [Microlunatus ginsengisoli]|uniref:Uncharacterized protein n=1 Tax=Microlunatus ginsengisoli TaxID=363863 RepID=A0ABP7AB65_9ACTN